MHRETVLTPADLIWPLFVTEGSGVSEVIVVAVVALLTDTVLLHALLASLLSTTRLLGSTVSAWRRRCRITIA